MAQRRMYAPPAPMDDEDLLQLHRVSVRAGNRQLIDHISFSVKKHQIITLMGPNGAGKTTIIRVILGTIALSDGIILRKTGVKLGYVPQKLHVPATLPMNVAEFLRLAIANPPQSGNVKHSLTEILQMLHIEHLYQQPLHLLSGGEKQRVLLARAIWQQPDMLLLDEPVQGIDMAGQIAFYQQLRSIRQQLDCAILLVSHDLHWVMAASDKVICINRHICCTGSPDDIHHHPEFIELFGKAAANHVASYHHHHDHSH